MVADNKHDRHRGSSAVLRWLVCCGHINWASKQRRRRELTLVFVRENRRKKKKKMTRVTVTLRDIR